MVVSLPVNAVLARAFSDIDTDDDNPAQNQVSGVYDPLEPMNRGIFWFNDKVDKVALKPIAKGYRAVVPLWGRQRVHSFLGNLATPVEFFNAALQGDVNQSFVSFWRFFMNSTFGIGGLFDIATLNNLPRREEDFGQTMGYYGVGAGPYLVLPILGPSSFRDTGGRFVDSVMDPFNRMDTEFVIARYAADVIDTREGLLDILDNIEKTSFDPYATIRSGYIQNQDAKIRNGGMDPCYNYKMKVAW